MDTVIPLQYPKMSTPKNQEKIRDHDIQALLEAGVSMVQLEDLYGPSAVHRVAEAYITSQIPTDDDDGKHRDRRSKLATLLFLRAPSSSLQSIMKSNDVVDAVFEALVADPEDPLLMDPLLHTPLHDPVCLSSGIVVDRSTAMDPVTGKLRLTKCPFRRIPLTAPVYEVYPIQEKVRAWEHSRLERCVSVARTMVLNEQFERAEHVFTIAHGFLQEHQQRVEERLQETGRRDVPTLSLSAASASSSRNGSSREILLLALQLAQLERELPGVKDDIERTVGIHRRIILTAQACSSDTADLETLVIACLEDCWKRCSMLLAFAGKNASKKALGIRHAFAPLIKYTTLMQLNLTEELQKLCNLDLTLAKHVEDEPSIWNCRRVLLKLLPDEEQPAFLQAEGITGDEEDLYYHLLYDASLWPQDKFADPAIGLVHFGAQNNNTSGDNPVATETRGLACKVNLNPLPKGDHWIEVAFRPDNIQSPGHLNSIISQHGDGTGWEIRCAVRPRARFVFGNPLLGNNNQADPGGIHVEAVWTTNTGLGNTQHNEFTNSLVPLEIGTWYHVVLAYCSETRMLALYVNGQVMRQEVTGEFVPARGLPKLGQNMQWPTRRFQGWIAFGGGGYELPVHGTNEPALDDHVQKLFKARLAKLPKQPALHKPPPVEDDEDVEDSSGPEGEDSSVLESISSGFFDSGMEDSGHDDESSISEQ